jgi:hypothetical protein
MRARGVSRVPDEPWHGPDAVQSHTRRCVRAIGTIAHLVSTYNLADIQGGINYTYGPSL